MSGFILGTKQSQSQLINTAGERIPVTVINTDNTYVTGIMTESVNGYSAVQVGHKVAKHAPKTVIGKLSKIGIKDKLQYINEFRTEKMTGVKIDAVKPAVTVGTTELILGAPLKANAVFKVGDKVTVSGVSKGKGFQGVVKRHHFKGGSRTHGQSHGERAPGSIGMTTTPGRVFKGKRMAGRMGNDRVTIKGLEVVSVDEKSLVIKGLVPGPKNGLLEIINFKA